MTNITPHFGQIYFFYIFVGTGSYFEISEIIFGCNV